MVVSIGYLGNREKYSNFDTAVSGSFFEKITMAQTDRGYLDRFRSYRGILRFCTFWRCSIVCLFQQPRKNELYILKVLFCVECSGVVTFFTKKIFFEILTILMFFLNRTPCIFLNFLIQLGMGFSKIYNTLYLFSLLTSTFQIFLKIST